MKKSRHIDPRINDAEPAATISDAELAQFLRDLATLVRSAPLSNPVLSKALLNLSKSLRPATKGHAKTKSKPRSQADPLDLSQLERLDSQGVEEFLRDETRTKFELIDLAAARFSIPRAQLLKKRTSEVRETIRAALLHEGSIEILTDEARKQGARRSS